MGYKFIETEFENGLGSITLNRPPVNILNINMMEEINEALEIWEGKKDLKVLLFKAKGKCFSAGVDVAEHTEELAPKMIAVFHDIFHSMERLGAVTIASIYGSCLGGGCELAVFCDMVVAAEDSTLGQPEIVVGVFPPIAAYLMPRIIGRKAAMELILSGKIISAEEALQMGLVNRVVKADELERETEVFVKPFLRLSAEVLRVTKKAVTEGLMDSLRPSLRKIEDIYLNELMKTYDAHEGLTAFMAKRRPEWKNE